MPIGDGRPRSRSRLGRGFWILVIVACAFLLVKNFYLDGDASSTSAPGVAPLVVTSDVQRLERAMEGLRADIDARHAKFREDVDALVGRYREMMPLVEADGHFKEAEDGAGFIASREGLCGFKASACLAYKMAYDKIKKTQKTKEAIDPIIQSRIGEPIGKAVKVYGDWAASFQRELQKMDQEFSMDLALRSQSFAQDVAVLKASDAERVNASIDGFVADVRKHARDSAIATVGVALELALVKSSYMAVKTVTVRIATTALSSVAAKMGTTATVAVGSTVVDGPLPIGDVVGAVVTIGGLTWTAVDIYKVTKTMPDEMRSGILKGIADVRDALLTTGRDSLAAEREGCLSSADARVRALLCVLDQPKKVLP